MKTLTLRHATAILPDSLLQDARIEIAAGLISKVVPDSAEPADGETIDLQGAYVAPGFVDIHVHGGAGSDFMDGTPEAARAACQAHLRHGTTTIFPTTTTGTFDGIMAMFEAVRAISKEAGDNCDSFDISLPAIPGIHLYGPYFAPDKCGCHDVSGRRDPAEPEYRRYFDTGFVRIATCAAELPGASAFYEAARAAGCLITCGHSNASWAEMRSAFEAGMRHVDHFWCAMSSVSSLRPRLGTPMQAAMEQFVLMNREMSTEVIADGCHLAPELLEFAYRMIGPDRLCLVTDSSRALDCPPGRYKFGHFETGSDFESDGHVGHAPGGGLASSVMGMDHMVRIMKRDTSATLPEVIRMATLTPARLTGMDDRIGSLEAGKIADLLVLDSDSNLQRVIRAGRFVV